MGWPGEAPNLSDLSRPTTPGLLDASEGKLKRVKLGFGWIGSLSQSWFYLSKLINILYRIILSDNHKLCDSLQKIPQVVPCLSNDLFKGTAFLVAL